MTTEQNRMVAEYQTKLDLQQQEQQNRELEAESERQASLLKVLEASLLVFIIGIFAALLYRANRKNREINQNLETRMQELEKANELKNKLFSIVAHDLRSPLGAIIWYGGAVSE